MVVHTRAKPLGTFFGNNNSFQGAGHPAYVYEQNGEYSKYLDITHSQIVKNKKHTNGKFYRYAKLYENPDPNDSSTAYISPFPYITKTKNMYNEKTDWRFSEKDLARIENFKSKKVH
jgi:hypothetical protein